MKRVLPHVVLCTLLVFFMMLCTSWSAIAQGAIQTVTFETDYNIGDQVTLRALSLTGAPIQVTGVDATTINDQYKKYTLTDKTVTITGPAKMLALFGNKITKLTFSNALYLDRIDCEENLLTELDVRNCPNLVYLYAHKNRLTSVDLSGCNYIKWFNCYKNQLTELDVRHLTELENLLASGNPLTSLDLSRNTQLKQLSCESCSLTELDLSNCPNLQQLTCAYNNLSSLNLSGCSKLVTLSCDANKLTAIDLKQFPELENFYAARNQLESLDFSSSPKLRRIYIESNHIGADAMTHALTSLLPGNKDQNEKYPEIAVIDLTRSEEKNICTKEAVKIATDKNWQVLAYTSSRRYQPYEGSAEATESQSLSFTSDNKTVKMTAMFEGTPTIQGATGTLVSGKECELTLTGGPVTIVGDLYYFEAFAQKITSIDLSKARSIAVLKISINKLKSLDVSTLSSLSTLDVTMNELKELNLSQNPKLARLYCYNNQLTSLDLSHNPEMYLLSCFGNQITSLDLSVCPKLSKLACDNNPLGSIDLSFCPELLSAWVGSTQLKTLDLSKNIQLQQLICTNNQLTSLDLSHNPRLNLLYCAMNQLSELDLTGKADMREIWLFNNKITREPMQRIVDALPKVEGDTPGLFLVINSPSPQEANVCTAEQVDIVKGKNWRVLDLNSKDFANDSAVDYAGSTGIDEIDAEALRVSRSNESLLIQGIQPDVDVRLLSIEGEQLLHHAADSAGRATLWINHLPAGSYLLVVGTQIHKVIL